MGELTLINERLTGASACAGEEKTDGRVVSAMPAGKQAKVRCVLGRITEENGNRQT